MRALIVTAFVAVFVAVSIIAVFCLVLLMEAIEAIRRVAQ
jgi:hypothetical protein